GLLSQPLPRRGSPSVVRLDHDAVGRSRQGTRMSTFRRMVLRAFLLSLWLAGSATATTHLLEVRGRDERGLSALLARQQDPGSADFHRWLTPHEFGVRFGASARDLKRVSRWLRGAGCRVHRFPSRRLVRCTGPAALEVPRDLRALGAAD